MKETVLEVIKIERKPTNDNHNIFFIETCDENGVKVASTMTIPVPKDTPIPKLRQIKLVFEE
jgi:hypothetical protein